MKQDSNTILVMSCVSRHKISQFWIRSGFQLLWPCCLFVHSHMKDFYHVRTCSRDFFFPSLLNSEYTSDFYHACGLAAGEEGSLFHL